MKELPKVYDPRDVESRIYKLWMDGDCFKAEPNPDKKPFSIVMPPPNVTGQPQCLVALHPLKAGQDVL